MAADREKKIMELQQTQKECSKQIKDLQHQLKVSHGQIREKDAVIAARQQEMQQLQQVTREKDHDIEIREQQLQQLNQQLTASQQVTAQLEETIQESQEEKKHLQQQLDKVLQQSMVIQKGKTNVVVIIGASLSNFHTSKSWSLFFFFFFAHWLFSWEWPCMLVWGSLRLAP